MGEINHQRRVLVMFAQPPELFNSNQPKVGSVSFSFSSTCTELTITNVVIANPAGDYRTPFLLVADRIQVHLQIWRLCAFGLQAVGSAGKLEGEIQIPFLAVYDLQ